MVLFLSRIFCALPLSWALGVGRAFGWVWYYLVPVRIGVARKNVARVFGKALSKREQRRLVRRSCEHLAMSVVEGLRLPILSAELADRLAPHLDFEHHEKARAQGRGVIVVASHMGSFELLAAGGAIRGVRLNIIFRDIHWKPAHDFWFAVRGRTGIKAIAPRRSRDDIRAALARGETVVFVIDQHMPAHRGIVCEFFGELASTTPAPVRFAYETGAPIVPVVIYRASTLGYHRVEFQPEFVLENPSPDRDVNIRHNTERLNRMLEGWIRRAPEQWLWMHRRWKVQDDPSGWSIPQHLMHLVGVER